MFKSSYSGLSYIGKLSLLIGLIVFFLLFSSILGLLCLVPFYGHETIVIFSNPDYANPSVVAGLKFMQIVNMGIGLLLPAWLWVWLTETHVRKYTGINVAINTQQILIAVALILSTQPLIGFLSEINLNMQLPQWLSGMDNWMRATEAKNKEITDAFLATTSWSGLVINLLMIAVLPAFAEEFLFRGVLCKLFIRWSGNIHVAVALSAIIFSAIHLQFFGFIPRVYLGLMLGYLFVWSGSLWLPIVVHFCNNALSVIVEFLFQNKTINTNAENFGTNNNTLMIVTSVVVVGSLFYYFYRTKTNVEN